MTLCRRNSRKRTIVRARVMRTMRDFLMLILMRKRKMKAATKGELVVDRQSLRMNRMSPMRFQRNFTEKYSGSGGSEVDEDEEDDWDVLEEKAKAGEHLHCCSFWNFLEILLTWTADARATQKRGREFSDSDDEGRKKKSKTSSSKPTTQTRLPTSSTSSSKPAAKPASKPLPSGFKPPGQSAKGPQKPPSKR